MSRPTIPVSIEVKELDRSLGLWKAKAFFPASYTGTNSKMLEKTDACYICGKSGATPRPTSNDYAVLRIPSDTADNSLRRYWYCCPKPDGSGCDTKENQDLMTAACVDIADSGRSIDSNWTGKKMKMVKFGVVEVTIEEFTVVENKVSLVSYRIDGASYNSHWGEFAELMYHQLTDEEKSVGLRITKYVVPCSKTKSRRNEDDVTDASQHSAPSPSRAPSPSTPAPQAVSTITRGAKFFKAKRRGVV